MAHVDPTPHSPSRSDAASLSPVSVHNRQLYVVNRRGEEEPVSFDRILKRVTDLAFNLSSLVDPARVTQAVVSGLYTGITTAELDELAAQSCAYMSATHPDYSKLAARISTSNLQKNTSDSFWEVISKLHDYKDKQGRDAGLISDEVHDFVRDNATTLDKALDYKRDMEYDYFAFKTLEKSYLLKIRDEIVERPQHLLMRVACGIHCGNVEKSIETYELMSKKIFTHATPTLFNSGTPRPQMSSCFLLTMKDDSIEGIFETLKQCALISKTAGGIGCSIHNIRATDSYIGGTNGRSNGIIPMLRVFNDTARYVDQGGGKRKGSFAIYLEPWHPDIYEFLDLRKNQGKEEARARDLFYALWIPDLFMRRVEEDGVWTLFCPNEAPGLADVWGAEFDALYLRYEREGLGRKQVVAQTLWFEILKSQIETGTPYMLYKDACNRKSNQQNLGTIKSSNLCTEIIEYTSPDEVAVCNLASIALPRFIDESVAGKKTYNFTRLHEVVKVVTKNLNRVIDRNYYPIIEARNSNMRHRPIGLGVQGLADAFMIMRYPYESQQAKDLNKHIFETIYHAAVEASVELAEVEGPYETFQGSPASKGILQFDMWGVTPDSGLWDWDTLKQRVVIKGMRNSLLVAPMPTASTSQILGNNESFEPYTSNFYYRRTLSGEFFVVNPHLLNDLVKLNLWDEDLKQQLMAENGSVQNIHEIPAQLKELYKTVWEIKQRLIIDMAADRGAYIDQSQSLNIHIASPNFSKLSSMHFHGWRSGLKTGVYYLRTQAAADAQKVTISNAARRSSAEGTSPSHSAHPHSVPSVRPVKRSSSVRPGSPLNGSPNVGSGEMLVCKLKPADDDGTCMMCSG